MALQDTNAAPGAQITSRSDQPAAAAARRVGGGRTEGRGVALEAAQLAVGVALGRGRDAPSQPPARTPPAPARRPALWRPRRTGSSPKTSDKSSRSAAWRGCRLPYTARRGRCGTRRSGQRLRGRGDHVEALAGGDPAWPPSAPARRETGRSVEVRPGDSPRHHDRSPRAELVGTRRRFMPRPARQRARGLACD